MSRTERLIRASPAAVFGVLAQPRAYAYWVIGSREVADADPAWPRPGSRFHHTVNLGPLRIKDHTKVEEQQPERFLQLKAKARPFGTARVKIALQPIEAGTHVTMTEEPADTLTAFLFQPLTHLLVRRRNVRSLDRLAELAEGRTDMPGDEPQALVRQPGPDGPVINPMLHGRGAARRQAAGQIARGLLAGIAGAAAMSVSTNTEMRLRRRPPSDAPVRAIERLLGIRARGRRQRMLVAGGGHLVTSAGLGAARGAMDVAAVPAPAADAALFGLALVPELVVVPALGASPPPWRWSAAEAAVTVLHHGVYAASACAAYARLRSRSAR